MGNDRSKTESKERSDLYKKSKKELLQQDILDPEEVNVLFENKKQNSRDPNKVGSFEFLSSILNRMSEIYHSKKSFGEIESVKIDDNIILCIKYKNHTVEVEIDSDSMVIPNLLEYYSVDNLQDLENKNIFVPYINFRNEDKILTLLPHNVSLVGSIRYKLYVNLFNIAGLSYTNISLEIFISFLAASPIIFLLVFKSTLGLIMSLPFIFMLVYTIICILLAVSLLVLYTENFNYYSAKLVSD